MKILLEEISRRQILQLDGHSTVEGLNKTKHRTETRETNERTNLGEKQSDTLLDRIPRDVRVEMTEILNEE